MNSEIIGRKEIFLFAILGLFVFFEKYVKDRYLLGLTLFIILALSLTHTGLLFYSPYLLFLFFIIKVYRNKKLLFSEILIITISLLIIFSLIYFNTGSKTQVVEICNSIKNFVKDDCINRGQFLWLYSPITEYVDVKSRLNLSTNFIIYLISLFFVFIFFSIKLYSAKFKSNNDLLNSINPFIIFFILFLCTIPVYIVGIDWGRYISMSYFSTYFIYIYLNKQKMITFNSKKFLFKRSLSKNIFFIFVFFYAFIWTFPFYGANNFKFTLKKPFISVLKIIND